MQCTLLAKLCLDFHACTWLSVDMMNVFVAEGKKKKSKTSLLSNIMTCASCLADSSLHTDPPWAVSTHSAWACGEKQLGLCQVKAGGAFQVHQNVPPAHPSMTKCHHCDIISHYSQVMGLIHEKEAEWSCNSFLKPYHQIKSIAKLYKECNFTHHCWNQMEL